MHYSMAQGKVVYHEDVGSFIRGFSFPCYWQISIVRLFMLRLCPWEKYS